MRVVLYRIGLIVASVLSYAWVRPVVRDAADRHGPGPPGTHQAPMTRCLTGLGSVRRIMLVGPPG